jgi:hypothetical protein
MAEIPDYVTTDELVAEVKRLRAEVARLKAEIRRLRAAGAKNEK